MKNYYAILEVPVGCSLEEIRQAYHRLVQEHLDDEVVFADLKEAYEVLTTPSRRADYDTAAWGETFDASTSGAPSASSLSAGALSAGSGTALTGQCPMGAEAHCPVITGRTEPSDRFCQECGYGLAALVPGTTFDLLDQAEPQTLVWLEERGGQKHPLKSGTNIVGRENAEILVADKTVSRSHARLNLDDSGNVTVEDLSSTNGTQINDEPLMPHVLRSLVDGDRLYFGSVALLLHQPVSASAGSDAAADGFQPEAQAHGQLTETQDGSEVVFPLKPGITTFGRRIENTVVMTEDLYVSGRHAQIHAEEDVFILTDLGSTNGTLLNGERLTVNTPFTLDTGDVIVIGGTSLRFDRIDPETGEAEASMSDGSPLAEQAEEKTEEQAEEKIADESADNKITQSAETVPSEIPAEAASRVLEG